MSTIKINDSPVYLINFFFFPSSSLADFFAEIYSSLKFFVDYMRGKPGTKSSDMKRMEGRKMDFGEAFGLTDDDKDYLPTTASDSYNKPTTGGGGGWTRPGITFG